MKGKVTCPNCGWSWNKSESSVKDMHVCHNCGKSDVNMKNGGWLDNYNDSKASAPEGMVGDGFSNVGRNYSPAWGGQFKEGGEVDPPRKKVTAESTSVYKKLFNEKELKNIIKDNVEYTRTGDVKKPRAEANKFEKFLPNKETANFFKKLKKEAGPAIFKEALKIQHERGNPAINVGTDKGLPFAHKRNYNPFTNEVNIPADSPVAYENHIYDYLKEVSHAGQPLSEVVPRFLTNDVPGYIKAYTSEGDIGDNIEQYVYDNPNTVENYTHSKIQPELEQRINSSYSWPKSKEEESDFLEYTRQSFNAPKYQMGGSVYPVNYVPQAQNGDKLNPFNYPRPDHYSRMNPFLVRDPEHGIFVGGVNPTYSTDDFSIGASMVGVGNKDFQKLPADYGIRGSYNPSKNLSINANLSKNNVGAGMSYRFENGGEMKYYQQGLDFQPKTISKNGGWLDGYEDDISKAQWGETLTPKQAELKKQTERNNRKIETQNKYNEYQENKRKAADLENKKAQAKSYVQANMEEAYKSPLMSPGYFTPEGMAVGALQGATKMGPDLYEGNYKGAAMDALMMLPFAKPAVKTLGAFKNDLVSHVRNLGSRPVDSYNLRGIGDLTTRLHTPYQSFTDEELRSLGNAYNRGSLTSEESRLFIRHMTERNNTGVSNQLASPPSEIHFNVDGTTSNVYAPISQSRTSTGIGNIDLRRPINGHAPGTPEWDRLNNIIISNSNPVAQIDRAILNETSGSPEWNRLQIQRQQLLGTSNGTDNMWAQGYKPTIRNRSGLTKEQILENKNLKNKDDISKMSEQEFQESVLKPTGEVTSYKPGTSIDEMTYNTDAQKMVLKDSSPLSVEEYANKFNENLDELNKIIAKNNKSGVEYKVKTLDPRGALIFETPAGQKVANTTKRSFADIMNTPVDELGNVFRNKMNVPEGTTTWSVDINPGQWKGEVQDIANAEYFKSIPGINMGNTTEGVFADNVARRGSGTYESINEYLKQLELGRVKPGFNSQTDYSRGLWENSVQKNKAFGYYNNPRTVYGSMKSIIPYAGYTGAGALTYKALQGQEEQLPGMREGGIIKDDRGQWDYPGEITRISGGDITMKRDPKTGKPLTQPILGIASTGQRQMMYPGQDYNFPNAEYVTEYPKGKRSKKAQNGLRQEQKGLQNLDNLTNFTNYNKPQPGGWLSKYE